MRPFVALAFLLSVAYGAPSGYLAAAPVAAVAAPVAAVAHAAPAVALPAPYSTETQGPGTKTVHQPAPIVQKQIHYGQTSYVSGYTTAVHKPPTPHLPIQVPTVLKGTQQVNAPIVKTQTEIHTVNEPVYVERRVEVPYDVPVVREQIIEEPVAVHVDRPYAVPHPVPVQGEPIVQRRVAAPIHTHSHHQTASIAAPVAAYAAAPVAAYAAAPAAVAAIH